jgi:uncharacterized membrane protein YeaQ/YmgE (transglycosylase-associated protein family)
MEQAGVNWGAVAGIGIALYFAYAAVGGLIIGALARWLLPGPDPMSYLKTMLYGWGGSMTGGVVGWLLRTPTWADLLLSIGGAALLIWYFRRRKPPVAGGSTPGGVL